MSGGSQRSKHTLDEYPLIYHIPKTETDVFVEEYSGRIFWGL